MSVYTSYLSWQRSRLLPPARRHVSPADADPRPGEGLSATSILTAQTPQFKIFVGGLDGRSTPVAVEVLGRDTVKDVSDRIFDAIGSPVERQRLMRAGKQLDPSRTLAEQSVKPADTLEVLCSAFLAGCLGGKERSAAAAAALADWKVEKGISDAVGGARVRVHPMKDPDHRELRLSNAATEILLDIGWVAIDRFKLRAIPWSPK